MGGGDLNLKKSWHPSTMKNMERVWKAEQQSNQEKKRIEELKREIEIEKDKEDLTKYAMDQGVIAKQDDKKLDWMYKGPNQSVNREEYLLGRTIDKSFEQMVQAEKETNLNSAPKNHVEHECIPPSLRFFSGNEQVDLARKIQEDPLYAIKKKEMETRSQLLKNPVKMKQLKQLLEQETQETKSEKKKKKKSKHKKQSNDSENEQELDRLLTEKYKELKGQISEEKLFKSMKKLKHKRKKSGKKSSDSSSDESGTDDSEKEKRSRKRKIQEECYEEHRNRKNEKISKISNHQREKYNRGNLSKNKYEEEKYSKPKNKEKSREYYKSDRRARSRSPRYKDNKMEKRMSRVDESDYRADINSRSDFSNEHYSKRNYGLVKADGSKLLPKIDRDRKEILPKKEGSKVESYYRKPQKTSLTEEEKEKRRQEMMMNASWRDKERTQNVKRYREEESKEAVNTKNYDTDFIRQHLTAAAEVSTVASRIKSNINNIQRSGRAMDTNFAKR